MCIVQIMFLPLKVDMKPILFRSIMPSAPIAHRGSGSALETYPLPALQYQEHVAQLVEHSVPGSRLELLIIPLVELSLLITIRKDFKSLSTPPN